jgi:Protein of unknown function (DUF1131)
LVAVTIPARQAPILAAIGRAILLGVVALLPTAAPASSQAGGSAPARTHAPAPAITLSPSGDRLGPVDAGTPFSTAELSSLFPAATVTEATGATEGDPYPVLLVAKDETPLLEVRSADGQRIHSVEIMAAASVGNLGARHGDTYAKVFGELARPDCVPGTEEQSGQVICPAPSSSHVSLVFAGAWEGPDGELPLPEVLREWTVARVIWRP